MSCLVRGQSSRSSWLEGGLVVEEGPVVAGGLVVEEDPVEGDSAAVLHLREGLWCLGG